MSGPRMRLWAYVLPPVGVGTYHLSTSADAVRAQMSCGLWATVALHDYAPWPMTHQDAMMCIACKRLARGMAVAT